MRLKNSDIPANFEVAPLLKGENPPGKCTCGTCGLSWDDSHVTSMTPVPSGRCPFELFHKAPPRVNRHEVGRSARVPRDPRPLRVSELTAAVVSLVRAVDLIAARWDKGDLAAAVRSAVAIARRARPLLPRS